MKLFQDQKPDVIISDYKMPVSDGVEFYMNVTEVDDTIPFIFLTGFESQVRAIDENYLIIEKPVQVSGLVSTVSELLERSTEEA